MALNSSNSNAGSNQPGIGAGASKIINSDTNKGLKTNRDNKPNLVESIKNPDNHNGYSKVEVSHQAPRYSTYVYHDENGNTWDSGYSPYPTPSVGYGAKSGVSGQTSTTTYQNNSHKPTMSVDEVFGAEKNNQPVVEKQGDYSASSNEKSNVKSSTFGDQDEISVTPTSVTENKGMIGNGAIQSVEGLDFHQKDKASVDVLDSKKKRDKVEAEDEADQMRNKLKGDIGKAAQQEGGENFKIGTSEAEKAFNKENAKKQAELDQKKKAAEDAANKSRKVKQDYEQKEQELDKTRENAMAFFDEIDKIDNDFQSLTDKILNNPAKSKEQQKLKEAQLKKAQEEYKQKIEAAAANHGLNIELKETDPVFLSGEVNNEVANLLKQKENELNALAEEDRKASKERYDADEDYSNAKKDYDNWKKGAETNLKTGTTPEPEPEPEPEPQPTPQSGAETSHKDAMDAIENSADATPEQKAQAKEVLTNLEESRQRLAEAAALAGSGDPAHLVEYQKALEQYGKNLKEAQKIGNRFTQTDFNKKFTRAVAAANDFNVKLADGTEMEYSDFATGEATKSPQYAKAMYESKADQFEQQALEYDENGNKVSAFINRAKAKIERIKAEWSQTWLGSKITFADNKVRDQFNQMAKTDMRATYAAYNNVLNDPNATPEQKAEASTAINQANALMTASAALQATTGFLSSAGDSPSDGVYGSTNPEDLNAWQKTLNTVDNITKIALGLGISPAANKAYQNMYYMAGDKVNNSLLFNKDFDGDGFALCQEYGNNAATGMIAGAAELAVGVAMMFNPSAMASGLDLIKDSFETFTNGLYGVRDEVEKSSEYTQEVLDYFKEAEDIAESSGNEEAVQEITNAITQIENFELKSDEVGNLDNWLEGSGSNTASNEKFNQSLSYDEWLKLIEADPVMRDYAKSLAEKKKDKDAQKDNVDTGVNS